MKRSYLMAGLLALGAAAWVASGQLSGGEAPQQESHRPPADLSAAESLLAVRVRDQQAELRMTELLLRGRTEARRKVEVKAETYGRVAELVVDKGATVESGEPVARLSPDDRPARLAEARALRDQRRLEYEAARRLNEKGYRAETQLAAAKAALEAAEAMVAQAEEALDDTVLRAPFAGVVSDRLAEIGQYLEVGDPVVRVLDISPILAVAQVSERDVDRIARGASATVRLITGRILEGRVHFVSNEADPVTRTFRVEVKIANDERLIADGLTAELRLPLSAQEVHHVSPAILSLDDSGIVGVKTLEPGNRVAFRPVEIIADDAEGVWLAGLPSRVTLITVGHEFVRDGQVVRPIDESPASTRKRSELRGAAS